MDRAKCLGLYDLDQRVLQQFHDRQECHDDTQAAFFAQQVDRTGSGPPVTLPDGSTVLVDGPEDSAAVQDETFGPTVTIAKVRTMDEAIERANGTRYALGSTVFAKENGMRIAEQLRAGMTAINGVISFAGIPTLPFGGVGESGFGRIHGADGLREFTYPHAIARQRFKPAIALTTFKRTAKEEGQLTKVVKGLHGRGKK